MLRISFILRAGLVGLCVILFAGCATPEQRADRALEAGDHVRALEFYKMEIAKDRREPELYYKAAQAAIQSGNLSLAERYYSRALRYGGGKKVTKALAQFYLKTSNYASAVRVLQRLLDEVEDTQPVYNNLGTALMYSGMPLDAESYLLIAQQMEPTDPIPYLNLGLLYDEHMNKPRLAVGFYKCYMQLGESLKQVRKVRVRVKEIRRNWGAIPSQFQVECGEPYEPGVAPGSADSLAAMKEETEREAAAAPEGAVENEPGRRDGQTIDLGVSGGEEPDPDNPPSIERQVEGQAAAQADADAKKSDDTLAALERAERAFAAAEYQKVVQVFSKLPIDALNPRNTAMYGISLHEVGRDDDAEQWLEQSLERRPTQRVFRTLVEIYNASESADELQRMCESYRSHPNLQEVVAENCPERDEEEQLKQKIRRQMEQGDDSNL
jgi:tetratricopeptide (TPR) repeat protein